MKPIPIFHTGSKCRAPLKHYTGWQNQLAWSQRGVAAFWINPRNGLAYSVSIAGFAASFST